MSPRDPIAMLELQFEESFASSARSDDAVREQLASLLDDYSLSDDVIGFDEDQDWSY